MKPYLKLLPLFLIGITQASSYTQKYDSTFGASIRGVYAWSDANEQKGELAPDMAGFLCDWHANIETGDVFHEISLTSGYWGGVDRATCSEYRQNNFSHSTETIYSNKVEMIPFLLGYTLNIPISTEEVYIYLGVKAGVMCGHSNQKRTINDYENSTLINSDTSSGDQYATDFTYSVNAGIRVALSKSVDLTVGYELFSLREPNGVRINYHSIVAGFSWTF